MPDLKLIVIVACAVIASAVLSSLLTLILAKRLFTKVIEPRIERRLRGEMEDGLEELGKVVEDRVKRGVLDAVATLPSTEFLRTGSATVVKTASGLVEGGLSSLLGGGKRSGRGTDDDR